MTSNNKLVQYNNGSNSLLHHYVDALLCAIGCIPVGVKTKWWNASNTQGLLGTCLSKLQFPMGDLGPHKSVLKWQLDWFSCYLEGTQRHEATAHV